jgi:AmiR/NasT family two-component response regulator
MAMNKITKDQAFDALRVASQHSHRKLRDVAQDVIDTGTLDLSGLGR